MDSCTIQEITIYHDGVIQIQVQCNTCKIINLHNITSSSIQTKEKTTIDFTKLGNRSCNNYTFNQRCICEVDYALYKT